MHFAGILPEDAPDPRLQRVNLLQHMPIPVITFVEQKSVEVTDIGVNSGTDDAGYNTMTASVSSTLWRKPEDKTDPMNLADLDEATQRALDEVPPWPRPPWLIEQVEHMRYPVLWEAVQTTWYRDKSEQPTLDQLLVQHVKYVLMNQHREQLALSMHDWDSPALPTERTIRHGIDVVIDGERIRGAEIDTDPFIYALGAKLPNGGTLTAVIAREHLPYLTLKFDAQH